MFAPSRFPLLFALAASLLCLAACADTELPKWFSAEPHRSDLQSYNGPISMPPVDAKGASYPNLADVPARPSLTPKTETDKVIADLQQDNAKGQAVIDDYNRRHEADAPAQLTKPVTSKKHKKRKAKRKANQ